MLLSLQIKDFVIVETLNLEFGSGFTVLTGETGAGKSIIIDALSLLLGDRSDAAHVRESASCAVLSAVFDISKQKIIQEWLIENALSEADNNELILRRVIDKNSRSRSFINNNSCTLSQLKLLAEYLVDIHGQHAHQSLVRADTQRQLLDAFAQASLLCIEVNQAYVAWQSAQKNLQQAQKIASEAQIERERLSWQINEISQLNLQKNEWEDINNQHLRLANSASLRQSAEQAQSILAENDFNCLSLLNQAEQSLNKAAAIDVNLDEALKMFRSADAELNEAAHFLRSYTSSLSEDTQSLTEIEARIAAIMNLARKYHIQPEYLQEKLFEYQQQLAALEAQSDLDALQLANEQAFNNYEKLANKLSEKRKHAACDLGNKISQQMQVLAMNGAKFEVCLNKEEVARSYGMESVEYQVAANSGAQLRALSKVASGGELSRISLAMQVVISQIAHVPSIIFDEVDSGIGGAVAEVVGKLLKKLGENYQVLAITHLAQVAACGDNHWLVSKVQQQNQTVSKIKVLDKNARIEEIARMLGGLEITEATKIHAKEMLYNIDLNI